MTPEQIEAGAADLRERARRARQSADVLQGFRKEAEENARKLEGPQAAFEYADFFAGLFVRSAEELEAVAGALPAGVARTHVDALRQLASNSAAEQRRCLMFRDKWVNKPLPYEEMRRVLNGMSISSREQLDDFRSLTELATQFEAFLPSPPPESDSKGEKGFDRRALFTRLFKLPDSER